MHLKQYYEQYWMQETPPPLDDPTTEDRKALLISTLQRYITPYAQNGVRVLDAGCGEGEFLEFFAKQGHNVYGVDVAEEAVHRARRRSTTASVQVGSLEEVLPFPPGFFDLVWCSEVLEHLFDIRAALLEVSRLVKDHGFFVLTTPYHGFCKNLAISLFRFEKHFDIFGPHIRFFTKQSLSTCLTLAGFEARRWHGVGRAWPFYKSFFAIAQKRPVQ
jgi:2-polyprenyl-6-hydroxyphenyl methylase/3-demethylubiquinone-9 3-methyltransferase